MSCCVVGSDPAVLLLVTLGMWVLTCLFCVWSDSRADRADRRKLFRHYTVGSYDSFDASRWDFTPQPCFHRAARFSSLCSLHRSRFRPADFLFSGDEPSSLIRHSGARRGIKNKSCHKPVVSITFSMFYIVQMVLGTTRSCLGGAVWNTKVISECFSALGCPGRPAHVRAVQKSQEWFSGGLRTTAVQSGADRKSWRRFTSC